MVAKDKALWKPNRVYTKKTARDTRYTKFITNIQDPFSEWNIVTLTEAYASAKGLSLTDARKEIKENPKLMDDFVILLDLSRFAKMGTWMISLGVGGSIGGRPTAKGSLECILLVTLLRLLICGLSVSYAGQSVA